MHHDADFSDLPKNDDGFYYSSYRNSRESGRHVTRSMRRGDDLFTFSENHVVKSSLDGGVVAAADLSDGLVFPETDDRGGGYYYGWRHG